MAGESSGTYSGTGGSSYGSSPLDQLLFGSGGGSGKGVFDTYGWWGGAGGPGGGIIYIAADSFSSWSGTISAEGTDGDAGYCQSPGGGGGGGSGGSIRIEGNTISATGSLLLNGGDGPNTGGEGGNGRSAVYYEENYLSSWSPNYLEDTSLGLDDDIFSDGFESGDLSHWSSSVTDGGNLAVDSEAAYWGEYGMEAVMDDNNAIYVQDDTPNGEQRYHARFYFNPNAITMASGEIFDLFQGYTSSTNVFRIQVQKSGGMYQVRIGARNDAGTWTDSAWQNLASGWNAIEVDYQAAHSTGSLRLWVGGTLKATLSAIDNDGSKIDSVRLGAQGVDTGTRGTIYFDDFDSRRFSEIGLLPDPGIQNPTPTPVPGWDNVAYTYGDPDHVHAVTSLSNGSTYQYDPNGNQTCRYENSKYYKQEYNAENRLYQVTQRTSSCSGTVLATWVFSYDGDGTRVKQVYTDGSGTLTTYYFFGGAYEVQVEGTTTTILKYYSFAGGMVAMHDGSSLKYFLTDHLSSVIAVLDASGNLLSEQRYLPFGQVRDDVGMISQTDFSFTGQRALDAQGTTYSLGLMDYRARFYSPLLGRFLQPDTLVPGAGNPQAWNRYSYVINSPINNIDTVGHWSISVTFDLFGRHKSFWNVVGKVFGVPDINQKAASWLDKAATAIDSVALVVDVAVLAVDTVGAIVGGTAGVVVGGAAAGPEASPVTGIPGAIIGAITADASMKGATIFANGLATLSTALTSYSDMLTEENTLNISLTASNKSVEMELNGSIGRDTATSLFLTGAGWAMPYGGLSAPLQATALVNDTGFLYDSKAQRNLGELFQAVGVVAPSMGVVGNTLEAASGITKRIPNRIPFAFENRFSTVKDRLK